MLGYQNKGVDPNLMEFLSMACTKISCPWKILFRIFIRIGTFFRKFEKNTSFLRIFHICEF